MSLKRCCIFTQNIAFKSKYLSYVKPLLKLHNSVFSSTLRKVLSLEENTCVCFGGLLYNSCKTVCGRVLCEELPAQGSMRKANSLSECRLLRVRRSGKQRRTLGKRVVSSGRRRVISDRRARIRPSCSCSTACMSLMPKRSVEHRRRPV